MPASTTKSKGSKGRKSVSKSGKGRAQLDILFAGPLLFVPEVDDGVITGVEVFAPSNGHPVGAVFVPGVWFSDAELDDPECERWPAASSFSLLDPHSYTIDLTQKSAGRALRTAEIPETNHKVRPGRRLSCDWEVAISVRGGLSGWSSHRPAQVTNGLFHGADAPSADAVASLHKLTYAGVTAADFCGASKEPREYLRANAGQGGSLIVIGEIPYQSTLLHERMAIDAIAKLAGLDLHLAETAPLPYKTRLMTHIMGCGHSVIVTE